MWHAWTPGVDAATDMNRPARAGLAPAPKTANNMTNLIHTLSRAERTSIAIGRVRRQRRRFLDDTVWVSKRKGQHFPHVLSLADLLFLPPVVSISTS